MISSILQAYGIPYENSRVEVIASGLINRTWKITHNEQPFILQRINDHVFKKPYQLAENIRMIDRYLAQHNPSYLFVSPIRNNLEEEIVHDTQEGFFRLFPFVQGSHTISVVSTPEQAHEAALQFGKFTKLLSGFDATKLHTTIPNFHNLILRYHQFEDSLKDGNPERIAQSRGLISEIKKHQHILTSYEKIKSSTQIIQRVTHHDTKISNVLFDDQNKGICVIDLDTVMPGYFISDMGDMMRTYLSPANEEEKDFNKIEIRNDFFRAIVQGYVSQMGDELTGDEKQLILYAGSFLIYMQAIRFLADYCNNDLYYGASYPEQNFVRAGNQIRLLHQLEEKSEVFQKMISDELTMKTYLLHP
jgi:Ser/Thr protein kinase RdoA (MazF antagonist)